MRVIVLILLVFLNFLPVFAQEKTKLLVQKIAATDVDEAMAKSIEEALVLELGSRENVSVVTSAEMKNVVKSTSVQAEMGCEGSDECLIEVQKKLAVETLFSGKITKLGDEHILSINTINVADKTVGQRISVEGKDLKTLKSKIKGSADILLGVSKPKQMFKLAEGEKLKLAAFQLAGVDYKKMPGAVDFSFNIKEGTVKFGEMEAALDSPNC